MSSSNITLPSTWQLGDRVIVNFGVNGNFRGEIIKIHFTESKVTYDLEIEILSNLVGSSVTQSLGVTRIYNVDSAFVGSLVGKDPSTN